MSKNVHTRRGEQGRTEVMAMEKALGYVRISKEEEGSVSLEYQRAEIERYAAREGYSLVGIEADEGISGKTIEARPAVKRVLGAVDEKLIDAVIVFRSDRMSRDGMESLQIEKLFLKRGVAYLSVTEGNLTAGDNADDEFMRFVRAGLNQRERKVIAMRTKTALAHKKTKGEPMGRAPYGWTYQDGNLVEEPSEQEVIERMTWLKAKGYSTRRIVDTLKADGIKTRKGTAFGQTQVVRILKAA